MLKSIEIMKHAAFEHEAERLLRGLLAEVPFLKVKSFQKISEVFGSQPDLLVEVEAGGRPWVLAVEIKRQGQPREVRNGLLQLQNFLNQTQGTPCYGVMVAP